MMVKVLSLGSNWWTRPGRDAVGPLAFRRNTAYYNSTGVRCGRKVRRHWVVPGLVRFNGVGDVNPGRPNRAIGRTFVCSDLTRACGGNRLLVKGYAHRAAVPDCYLIVVSGAVYGRIDFSSAVWKSILSPVIAASCLRNQQEAMLLMKPGDWVQTEQGFWLLSRPTKYRDLPRLVRIGDRVSA
jgi:hypothetical protein